MRRRWWVLIGIILVFAFAAGGFLGWAQAVSPPMPVALAALQSDGQVRVDTSRWLVFQPVSSQPSTGFIFYPGARVDLRAYAPALRSLAGSGYLAVAVPMPLNLAFLGKDRASEVMGAYPLINRWVLGGHSLGGSFAAVYAAENPQKVRGLVLWASYPPDGALAPSNLPVVSIYGSRDGLATPGKVLASRPLLPASARFVEIAGGNHAQFGWYGPQDGDNAPAIARDEQQVKVVAATRALLEQVAAGS
jgi:pimeloyl-ACP methyl ester carboxylesterase